LPIITRIEDLRALKDGWDGHGGKAPTRAALGAIHLWMMDAQIVPLSNGGIQIEWHRDGLDIEVEIDADGRLSGFNFNRAR
jgi:hypothetical protein